MAQKSSRKVVIVHYYGAADSPASLRDHVYYRSMFHDPATDEDLDWAGIKWDLVEKSGAQDGDEVEITMRVTGRRPFGNRKVRFTKPHTYEREKGGV